MTMFFMRVGSCTIPAQEAIFFADRLVVDAGVAVCHVAVFIEFPVLIAMAAPPLACGVVPLVFKAHGDAVTGESPEGFLQTVVMLFRPLGR